MIPSEQLKSLGISLPNDYKEFLQKHYGDVAYSYDDNPWELVTADELLETIKVDGQKFPAICRLQGYAASLKEVLGSDETIDATDDEEQRPYPLERLADGLAIGSDSSGDILYLDPAADYSVWVFHHDGGDVEKVAKSFRAWKKRAQLEE